MNYSVKTDVGVVRSENQDRAALFEGENCTLAILCDGMGGHMGGSHASSITIATFEKEFRKGFKLKNIENWFHDVIKKTKIEMTNFASQDSRLLDMGTTVTAAIITHDDIYVFNIGDSRTYVYNGLLHQITKDDNVRNHYIKKFGYTPEEAARVPGAAALTAALGPTKKTKISTYILAKNENVLQILLTSDGIHDYIPKPTIENIISDESLTLDKKTEKLITQAIRGKSSDNLTAILIDLEAQ